MKQAKVLYLSILIVFLFIISACRGVQSPNLTQSAAPTETAAATNTPAESIMPTTPPVQAAALITSSNASRLKMVRQIEIREPLRLTWVKDGQSFWVVSQNGATLYNSQTFQAIATFSSEASQTLLDVSADGRTLAATSDNSSIQLLDAVNKKELGTIQTSATFGSVDFSADGSWLAAAAMDQWQVTLWDVSGGKKVKSLEGFETAAPVYDAQLGGDGNTLIWHARGTIQLQDIPSGKMRHIFSHEDFVTAEALSADGKTLATAAAGTVNSNFTPLIIVWDARSGTKLATQVTAESTNSLSFSSDGKLLASASGNRVIIWDVISHQKLADFEAHSEIINSLGFSPDGKVLLTCGTDHLVKRWQTEQ